MPNETPSQSSTGENLTWHAGSVDPRQRAALLSQRGCVVWFTGLSACGKSTIANAIASILSTEGFRVEVEDVDLDAMNEQEYRAWNEHQLQRLVDLAKTIEIKVATVQTKRGE